MRSRECLQSDHELMKEAHSEASLYGNLPRPLHGEHHHDRRHRQQEGPPWCQPSLQMQHIGGALAFDQDVACWSDGSGCPDVLMLENASW
jgi:hypothetical protein